MQRFLLDLGVSAKAMVLETGSTNTAANAEKTAALLTKDDVSGVLLVTSALHMPRAKRLFEKAGLTVIPAPTDFEVVPMSFDLFRVMPSVSALDGSARAMKELVGILMSERQ